MTRRVLALAITFTAAATVSSAAYADDPAPAPGATAPPPGDATPTPPGDATESSATPPGAAAATDATATAPPLPPPKGPTPIAIRADGGYTLRRVVDLPLTGADMGIAIGAQPERFVAFWGTTRLMLGSTEGGLGVYTWRIGGDFDLIFDRLRFSPGVNVFIVGVERATRNDTIVSWGFAAHAGVRADLVQLDGFALFARADIDAGWEVQGGSLYWGPTLGGGLDFDIHGTRPK